MPFTVRSSTCSAARQTDLSRSLSTAREWPFAKLVRQQIDADGLVVLSASNRRRPEEIAIGRKAVAAVVFRMTTALAAPDGTTGELRTTLQKNVVNMKTREPK